MTYSDLFRKVTFSLKNPFANLFASGLFALAVGLTPSSAFAQSAAPAADGGDSRSPTAAQVETVHEGAAPQTPQQQVSPEYAKLFSLMEKDSLTTGERGDLTKLVAQLSGQKLKASSIIRKSTLDALTKVLAKAPVGYSSHIGKEILGVYKANGLVKTLQQMITKNPAEKEHLLSAVGKSHAAEYTNAGILPPYDAQVELAQRVLGAGADGLYGALTHQKIQEVVGSALPSSAVGSAAEPQKVAQAGTQTGTQTGTQVTSPAPAEAKVLTPAERLGELLALGDITDRGQWKAVQQTINDLSGDAGKKIRVDGQMGKKSLAAAHAAIVAHPEALLPHIDDAKAVGRLAKYGFLDDMTRGLSSKPDVLFSLASRIQERLVWGTLDAKTLDPTVKVVQAAFKASGVKNNKGKAVLVDGYAGPGFAGAMANYVKTLPEARQKEFLGIEERVKAEIARQEAERKEAEWQSFLAGVKGAQALDLPRYDGSATKTLQKVVQVEPTGTLDEATLAGVRGYLREDPNRTARVGAPLLALMQEHNPNITDHLVADLRDAFASDPEKIYTVGHNTLKNGGNTTLFARAIARLEGRDPSSSAAENAALSPEEITRAYATQMSKASRDYLDNLPEGLLLVGSKTDNPAYAPLTVTTLDKPAVTAIQAMSGLSGKQADGRFGNGSGKALRAFIEANPDAAAYMSDAVVALFAKTNSFAPTVKHLAQIVRKNPDEQIGLAVATMARSGAVRTYESVLRENLGGIRHETTLPSRLTTRQVSSDYRTLLFKTRGVYEKTQIADGQTETNAMGLAFAHFDGSRKSLEAMRQALAATKGEDGKPFYTGAKTSQKIIYKKSKKKRGKLVKVTVTQSDTTTPTAEGMAKALAENPHLAAAVSADARTSSAIFRFLAAHNAKGAMSNTLLASPTFKAQLAADLIAYAGEVVGGFHQASAGGKFDFPDNTRDALRERLSLAAYTSTEDVGKKDNFLKYGELFLGSASFDSEEASTLARNAAGVFNIAQNLKPEPDATAVAELKRRFIHSRDKRRNDPSVIDAYAQEAAIFGVNVKGWGAIVDLEGVGQWAIGPGCDGCTAWGVLQYTNGTYRLSRAAVRQDVDKAWKEDFGIPEGKDLRETPYALRMHLNDALRRIGQTGNTVMGEYCVHHFGSTEIIRLARQNPDGSALAYFGAGIMANNNYNADFTFKDVYNAVWNRLASRGVDPAEPFFTDLKKAQRILDPEAGKLLDIDRAVTAISKTGFDEKAATQVASVFRLPQGDGERNPTLLVFTPKEKSPVAVVLPETLPRPVEAVPMAQATQEPQAIQATGEIPLSGAVEPSSPEMVVAPPAPSPVSAFATPSAFTTPAAAASASSTSLSALPPVLAFATVGGGAYGQKMKRPAAAFNEDAKTFNEGAKAFRAPPPAPLPVPRREKRETVFAPNNRAVGSSQNVITIHSLS